MATTLAEIDLTDPDLYARGDPHAAWRLLRERAPVYRHPQRRGPGFWAVTRYADVARVSADPGTFISAGGTSTMDLERTDSRSAESTALDGSLVLTDPPRHTKLRGLVNKAFTPRAVAALEPFVRRLVGEVIDDVAPRGECDFVADVAARLPFVVICELLGVPSADRADLFRAVGFGSRTPPGGDAGSPRRRIDLRRYFGELAAARRTSPADDLVSGLVRAELDGERLTDDEVVAFCVLLFAAGSETTVNAISGGLLALIEHPDQRRRLAEDGSLLPSAVEEMLRWSSPVMVSMIRTATRDVVVGGELVRSGEKVSLWYPSANRDETVFANPDAFDVARAPNDHIAFGFGEHFCLGANLARLEMRVTFEELLRRLPRLELAGPPARMRSNIFYAIERMPVSWSAA